MRPIFGRVAERFGHRRTPKGLRTLIPANSQTPKGPAADASSATADAHRSVIVFEEIDANGNVVLQDAALPDGERSEARAQFMRDLLNRRPRPYFAGLIDLALPQHVFVVAGYADRGGQVAISEVAEHRSTDRTEAALERIFEFLVLGVMKNMERVSIPVTGVPR